MEFVEWPVLSEVLAQREKLPEDEFLEVGRGLCLGLEHAHKQGIIHQDIKPSNIFVGDGKVKLADFGVARVAKETVTRLTGRMPSGTLVYMSPETLRGFEPTTGSDIYSLAVVCYEILSGEPPFVRGDIFRQHQEIAPKPIEGVSERLNETILACLEKEPERRPGSAEEVWKALSGEAGTATVGAAKAAAPASPGKTEASTTPKSGFAAIHAPRAAGAPQIYNCAVCGSKIKADTDDFYRCPNCREYVCPEHYDRARLMCSKCGWAYGGIQERIGSKRRWITFWRVISVLVLIPMIGYAFAVADFAFETISERGQNIVWAVEARSFTPFIPLVVLIVLANILGFIGRKKKRLKWEISELREQQGRK